MRPMRFRAALPLLVASCLPPCSFAACSGGQVGPPAVDAGGGDAAMQPQTATCSGAATQCLSGTLATKGMTAQLQLAGANLFRVFPYGAAKPIAAQLVAKDGTWAFSNL